jgi:hypothetical protein
MNRGITRASPVAANQVVAGDAVCTLRRALADCSDYLIAVVFERQEFMTETDRHVRLGVDGALQDRLDLDLGDPHSGFARLRTVVLILDALPLRDNARI